MQASCRRLTPLGIFLTSLLLLSCTASGFSNGVFRGDDVSFAVGPVPSAWRQVEPETSDSGLASFAFRNEQTAVTVGGTGRCGRDADDVPLQALTQHLTIGFTDRSALRESPQTLDGRAALRTELTASLDGVPVHLAFVVIKKDRCVYDFWWIAPTNVTDTTDFDRFVAGFRTLN